MHCVDKAPIVTLDDLRAALAAIGGPLSIQQLPEFVSRLQLHPSQWRAQLTFHPERFSFRTIYASPHFEINIIGWRSGQFSSIHDHRGTACCVLVLDGVLTNVDYYRNAMNAMRETSRVNLHPGEVLSRNAWEIHRCGNDQPCGSDLATLHFYSPPLLPLEQRQHAR